LFLIALDIGTTSLKTLVLDDQGCPLLTLNHPYPTQRPIPGFAEQNPKKIWDTCRKSLENIWMHLPRHECRGITLSAAMHSFLLLDEKENPLCPLILWSDNRAAPQARALRAQAQDQALYQRSGLPVHPMSPLCKWLWFLENKPEICRRTRYISDIKSFIIKQLCGVFALDISLASASGWMDLRQMQWSEEALACGAVPLDCLPRLVPPTEIFSITHPVARNLPLIAGASDGCLAHLGSGAATTGRLSVTVGTSSAVRKSADAVQLDADMRHFCYRLDARRLVIGGGSNSGAGLLDWARRALFASREPFERWLSKAETAPPGADGLLFLPYLQGERAPWWQEDMSGQFSRVRIQHQQAHFIQAVLEGITFNIDLIINILCKKEEKAGLQVSGGLARSDKWMQLLADVSDRPVFRQKNTEASALGAAMVAREALGLPHPDNEKQIEQSWYPGPHAPLYQHLKKAFEAAARHLVAVTGATPLA
jgi:gluconokinase